MGQLTFTFKVKLNSKFKLKSTFTPFWACEFVRAISHHQLKSVFQILDHCYGPYWFWAWLNVIFSFIFNLKPVLFYQTMRLLFICVGLYIFSETIASQCSTFHRALHICGFLYAHGQGSTVDRETALFYFLVGPSEPNEPSTRRLALDFTSSYWFSPFYTHLTWRNFICQHSVITEATVKRRPLVFIWFNFHWETPGSVGSGKYARHRDTGYPQSVPHSY